VAIWRPVGTLLAAIPDGTLKTGIQFSRLKSDVRNQPEYGSTRRPSTIGVSVVGSYDAAICVVATVGVMRAS